MKWQVESETSFPSLSHSKKHVGYPTGTLGGLQGTMWLITSQGVDEGVEM